MPASTTQPWTGIYPIAPTPFDDTGGLDLPGMRRVLDCMIDQGVDGICILANYSEQFLLTDDERATLLELCCSHVAGRVPVIVTCSHFSTRIAGERARAAAQAGAQMLMLMPPYHGTGLRADEAGMLQHFAHVAEVSRLPIMVQDAPLSGVALSVPFLVRLAREVPLVRYFKIEVPQAAAKLRALIEAGGDAIEGPFDGEESITLMADLDAGATGTMCSALLPDLIKPVVEHFLAGRRAEAAPVPIMVQDAPLSGVTLSVPLLVRLSREVPSVQYFKIEVPGAAAKLRALIEAGGPAIAGPFDGEESITLMADLDAGATGTMSSALLPDLIKPVVLHHRAGQRKEAAAAYASILPLINFENRQCGLRATKTVMAEGGVIASDAVRHPLERLHPATKAGLLELARDLAPLALRWGR